MAQEEFHDDPMPDVFG
jgi:phosphoglycolate phosphatase